MFFGRFLFLLVVSCFGVTTAISESRLDKLISEFLNLLPPVTLPDVSLKALNLYANATNITLYGLTANDFQLFVQDSEHLDINLRGVGGKLSLDLNAGITGPIPIHHKMSPIGTLGDVTLNNTFLVAKGNAAMSDLDIDIGKLKLDFGGKDPIDQFLADEFLPFLKKEIERTMPPVLVLAFKTLLDFQHLMELMLVALPALPVPNISLSLNGYDLTIANVKLTQAKATSKNFSITKENFLSIAMAGISGGGSFNFTVGKVGEKHKKGVASIDFKQANLDILSSATKSAHNGYVLKYRKATNTIGTFALTCAICKGCVPCDDPLVAWLMESMGPVLKSLLENLVPFAAKSFLDLP